MTVLHERILTHTLRMLDDELVESLHDLKRFKSLTWSDNVRDGARTLLTRMRDELAEVNLNMTTLGWVRCQSLINKMLELWERPTMTLKVEIEDIRTFDLKSPWLPPRRVISTLTEPYIEVVVPRIWEHWGAGESERLYTHYIVNGGRVRTVRIRNLS